MKSLDFRHIAALIMIGLMLFSGVPFFVSEDANQDWEIDIRDAVIRLQMTDHKGSFDNARDTEKNIAACENTMKVVAGLKEIASPTFETEKSLSSHFCFLISCVDIHPMFPNYVMIIEHPVSFSSFISSTPHQPPILS